jgi:arylsulfatase
MVYPLDSRSPIQKFQELPAHQRPPASSRRRFLPGAQTVHRSVIVPLIADRCYSVVINLMQKSGDQGVLFAIGDVTGGMVCWIESGHVWLFYNGFGEPTTLTGPRVPDGAHEVRFDYEALGKRKGRGRLMVGSTDPSAWTDTSPSMLYGFHEGLDIGLDRRGPVSWDLKRRHGAFRYSGTIRDLVIESGAFAPDSAFGKG